MTIKLYISSTCGNKEMKKHQMKAQLIMESKGIDYVIVDIADPVEDDDKKFMQENAKPRTGKYPLPPQFFNDSEWCGDYESFDEANETDGLEKFFKLPVGSSNQNILKQNGNNTTPKEASPVPACTNGESRLSEERQTSEECEEDKSAPPMESKEVSRNSEEPNDKEKSMEGGTSDNSAEVSEEEEDVSGMYG
nr:EOG090X0DPU [Artemia franciscana]